MSEPFTTEMEEFEDDVGLGAEDKKYAKNNREEWFKGEKNRTYRASIVYFHPIEVAVARALHKKFLRDKSVLTKEAVAEAVGKALAKRAEGLGKAVDQLQPFEKLDLSNSQFKRIIAHYKEGVGYAVSRLGKDGADADEAWKMMGDPKTYFTTALLLYPTNNEGEPIKEQLTENWMVKPWRFGSKIYRRFHEVAESLRANDLSIADQDLSLKCTNAEFQNFDVDGAGKAIWRKDPRFQARVLERASSLYDKLNPFRDISSADLRTKLGLSNVSGSSGEDTGDDFNELLDNV